MPKQKSKNQGNKNKGKKGKGQGHLTKTQRIDALYDPRSTLTGSDLLKLAKKETKLQTKPAIHAGKRTLKSLTQLLGTQTDQLGALDQQASGNVSSYYKNLATKTAQNVGFSQALAGRLRGDVGQAGANAGQAIQGASQDALGRLAAAQATAGGTQTGAQNDLNQLIVQQTGDTAREGQALQGAAAARGNDWVNMLLGQGQAAQQRGGEQLSDIHRDVANKVTDLQGQYLPQIRDALGSINDARAQKGTILAKSIADLTDRERQFILSQGALGVNKGQLALDTKTAAQTNRLNKKTLKKTGGNAALQTAKQYGKNKLNAIQASLESQLKVAKAQGDNKKAEQLRSRISQLKVIAAQKGGQGGKDGSLPGSDKHRSRAMSLVRRAKYENKLQNQDYVFHNKQSIIDQLVSKFGISNDVARWAVNKYTKDAKKINTALGPQNPLETNLGLGL